ncbi:MAG: hypothetical protein WCQ49_00840 [Candidatus Saccharibacteria bacterium]
MTSYKRTKIIPIAILLVIIAVSIAALVSLARIIFFSGSSTPKVSQVEISKEALLSPDADHAVLMSVRGPIVSDEEFRSYQIKITANSREITSYSGYLDKQIDKISLSNNTKAYEQFIFALYKANMIKGTELSGDKNDLRGICANGKVFSFQVFAAAKAEKQLWTSTCAGSKGSLSASVTQLTNLFTAQIPDSKKFIDNIW